MDMQGNLGREVILAVGDGGFLYICFNAEQELK